MKKIFALILALCMIVALSATAMAEEPGQALKIGLTMQTLNGAYFAAQEETFAALCQEKGYEYVTADANGDTVQELTNIENFIAQGCNVIVMNPVHAEGSVGAAELCQEAGVALFIMDNSISSDAEYVSMIQSDNYSLGILVGNDVAKHFGSEEIKLGLLSGNVGNTLGDARRDGTIAGIVEQQLETRGEARIDIVTQGWGAWNQADGLSAAENMLTAAPEMNCIFAENDDMALGAYEACQAIGRDDIIIASADGNKTVLGLIKDGSQILATGRNNPSECAAKVIETIEKWNAGEPVLKTVYLTPVSVSLANIDNYYDPDSTF